MNISRGHTPFSKKDKLVRRIEGLLEWMDYQEVSLTFWDELRYLLLDLKEELE